MYVQYYRAKKNGESAFVLKNRSYFIIFSFDVLEYEYKCDDVIMLLYCNPGYV